MPSNLSEKISSNSDEILAIIQNYFYPVIYFSGSILNILCVVVFWLILFSKNEKNYSKDIFEISFCKSLNDSLLFICNIFSPFFYCNQCLSKDSMVMHIWNIGFNLYLTRVFELVSIYLEILATCSLLFLLNPSLNRYCTILSR